MKHSEKTKFTALNEAELENTFGGKTVRVYYEENGVLKWKEVKI
ncbi:MAG: hypothetical protein Q4G63_02355 [Bacteroidia bacterium]|nr:hypothetical protein [Bacteroidia bacterium]